MALTRWLRLSGVVIFGALASIALMLGVLGQFGRWSDLLDGINNFSQIWMLQGIVGGAGLLLFAGCARGFGILSIAAIWVFAGLNFTNVMAPVVDRDRDAELRVIQFNAFKDNRSPDAAAAWILAQEPDVVVLEEGARQGGAVRDLLKRQLPFVTDCLGQAGDRCSTMILSAERPFESGGLADGDPENRGALSSVWARFQGDRGPYTIVGAHIIRPWPYGDQTEDLRRLMEFVTTLDPRFTIVAGDFNQTPWTFRAKRLRETMNLRIATGGLRSWPVGPIPGIGRPMIPLLAIDHIYVGEGWTTTGISHGPPVGSDHLPIVIDLTTASSPPPKAG